MKGSLLCVVERGNDSAEFRLGWEVRAKGVHQVCRPLAAESETETETAHILVAKATFMLNFGGGRRKGPDSSL